jgi:SHAQKYF class myb-like DNA-binding protein
MDNSRRRWSDAENALFLQGLEALGRTQWRRIASEFVRTRSAEQVRSKVQKHFKSPPRPREEEAAPRRSLGDLPDVLLAGALDYSDLGEVAACAAASVQLRDGLRRVAPALQRRLVLRRFPILSTIGDDTAEEPPPRELFLSQTRLFADRPAFAPLRRAFDDYVFSLELELKISRRSDQGVVTTSRESIFVGRGKTSPCSEAQVEFDIPSDVFDRVWSRRPEYHLDTHERLERLQRNFLDPTVFAERLFLRLMASKGYSRARLGQGEADDYENFDTMERFNYSGGRQILFINLGMGEWRHGEADALDWLRDEMEASETYNFFLPAVTASWNLEGEGDSKLRMDFELEEDGRNNPMTREKAAEALERYANWT